LESYPKRGKASTSGVRGRTDLVSMTCSPLASGLIVGKPLEMGFTGKEVKKKNMYVATCYRKIPLMIS
jgi:hypothetical protein